MACADSTIPGGGSDKSMEEFGENPYAVSLGVSVAPDFEVPDLELLIPHWILGRTVGHLVLSSILEI